MNRRVLLAVMATTFACSSSGSSSGTGGASPGSGGAGPGSGGSNAGTGGASTGSGGTNAGTGGITPGSGGAGPGSGGATTGSGGATTGSGGRGTAGSGAGTGGRGNGGGPASTGGAVGTGGGAAGGATSTGASVLERQNHPSRDGLYLQPQITKASVMAAAKTKDAGFAGTFTDRTAVSSGTTGMYASPLYIENGPGGKGAFIAALTNNDVYAIDETTGAVLWKTNLGQAPAQSGAGCGNVKPLGALSTPIIDAKTRKLYVATAIGTTGIMKHEVHQLSIEDGSDAKAGGWPVDVGPLKSGSFTFSGALTAQNQRSALSLINGILYVGYGGHAGDCGSYHGWVIAIDTTDPTKTGAWASGNTGEGIWQAGGLASDGDGVFATTGNDLGAKTTHMDSEQVIRITGMGTADRTGTKNYFYPMRWMSMDGSDYDLNAVNPVYITEPAKYLVQISKDGHFYILDATNLGGMGGQLVDFTVASAGMSIHGVPTAYKTAAGMHVSFMTDSGAMCPMGMPSGKVVMSVLIPAGSPPKPMVVWCASLGSTLTGPMTTTSDGTNDAIVWFMNAGKLTALDGDTGAVLYTSTDTCAGIRQWTSPIAVKGRIVAGGDGQLCSWTVK